MSLTPPSVSIASSAKQVCGNEPVTFTAIATAGGPSPQYQWMINGTTAGQDSIAFVPPLLDNGDIISCLLTNSQSCAAVNNAVSNTISLPVYASPTVDAGPFVAIDYGSSTLLQAVTTGTISTVIWSPAAGLSNSHTTNPVASPKATTLYTVQVQSADDCTASDTVTVKIISKGVAVPAAFTPNNDGDNDIFRPVVLGAAVDYLFVVYNRWGQQVFESKTPGAGWDGTLNGHIQPAGTYTWILQCTLDTNVRINKKGNVVLIK